MKVKLPVVLFFFALSISFFSDTAYADMGTWQKGLTLRLINESNEDIIASLEQAKDTGANFITITPGWLTDNIYSSNIERKDRTPTDEKLIFTINKAHELGMQVMLKPHLDRKDGGWRAFIDPVDKETFFQNYSQMILHYAEIGEQYNVEQFSVGAELFRLSTNLDNEQYWRDMITQVRNIYGGKLTYSANAGDTPYDESRLPFWDMLDYWGLSMYIEVADNTSPTPESIAQKWLEFEEDYLLPRQSVINLPILAAEIGYKSINGAGMDPGDFSIDGSVDLAEQQLLYQAFFEYWKDKDYFAGLHIWDWKPNTNAGGSLDKDYTPQNKPAGELIKAYFTNQNEQEQLPSTLISNVRTLEYTVVTLNENQTFYSDRKYTITSLPDFLIDKYFIRSKNSDKFESSNSFVQLDLAEPSTVFVAFDNRVTTLPTWLAGWDKTSHIITTTDVPFNLYKKTFDAGTVTFGGNSAAPMAGAKSNYFIIAVKNGVLSSNTVEETPQEEDTTTNEPPVEPEEVIEEDEENVQNTFPSAIEVIEPKENKEVSGEKKLKVHVEGQDLSTYSIYYNVEGRGEVKMGESTFGFKQSKIDFNTWDWHGEGFYTVVLTARDNSGNLIDTTTIQINVTH